MTWLIVRVCWLKCVALIGLQLINRLFKVLYLLNCTISSKDVKQVYSNNILKNWHRWFNRFRFQWGKLDKQLATLWFSAMQNKEWAWKFKVTLVVKVYNYRYTHTETIKQPWFYNMTINCNGSICVKGRTF